MKKTGWTRFLSYVSFWEILPFRRKQIPWCISTGMEWVFGILIEEDGSITSYRLSRSILLSQNNILSNDVELVLRLLLAWVHRQFSVYISINISRIKALVPAQKIAAFFAERETLFEADAWMNGFNHLRCVRGWVLPISLDLKQNHLRMAIKASLSFPWI